MHSAGVVRAWTRLALIPAAILLTVTGVWMIPSVLGLGHIAAIVVGLLWTVVVVIVLRLSRGPDIPDDARADVEREIFVEGSDLLPWLARFTTLLTLSAVIATLGLLSDSTAVVIGAMVIAPLMAPLMSLAGALTLAMPWRAGSSAAIVVAGSALTVAVAAFLSWVVPGTDLTEELLARTRPGLPDLGIALAAGAAGGYVSIWRRELGALPGVAIAVALVPPLATFGVLLELGQGYLAEEALILYGTNVVAIVLAAAIVFVVVGLTVSAVEIRNRARVRVGLGIAVAAALAVMIPLAQNSVSRLEREDDENALRQAFERELRGARTAVEQVTVTYGAKDGPEGATVVLEVSGSEPPAIEQLTRTAADTLDTRVLLNLRWRFGDVDVAEAP